MNMATSPARFLVFCLLVAIAAAQSVCTSTPLVSASNVYTANSDPANSNNNVNCFWLDRSRVNCEEYGHLADEGEWDGQLRMCKNHATNPDRCETDDASAVRCVDLPPPPPADAPVVESPTPTPTPPPTPPPSPLSASVCTSTPLVTASNVYTANSDPANSNNKVNCFWLDRSRVNCADIGHLSLAPEGEFFGSLRMCMNHPTNADRCSTDDASAVSCAHLQVVVDASSTCDGHTGNLAVLAALGSSCDNIAYGHDPTPGSISCENADGSDSLVNIGQGVDLDLKALCPEKC